MPTAQQEQFAVSVSCSKVLRCAAGRGPENGASDLLLAGRDALAPEPLPPSHILQLCIITSRHVLVLASGYLAVETVPPTAGENHNLSGSPEANTVAVTKCISC